jgi:hypothetical protein
LFKVFFACLLCLLKLYFKEVYFVYVKSNKSKAATNGLSGGNPEKEGKYRVVMPACTCLLPARKKDRQRDPTCLPVPYFSWI